MCMSFKFYEIYFTISGRFGIIQMRMFCNKVLYSIFKCLKSLISWIPLIPTQAIWFTFFTPKISSLKVVLGGGTIKGQSCYLVCQSNGSILIKNIKAEN